MAHVLRTFGFLFVTFFILLLIFISPKSESPTGKVVDATSVSSCIDTDGGKYYRKYGNTFAGSESHGDTCVNETMLMERFCNAGYVDRILVRCNCRQGMCI